MAGIGIGPQSLAKPEATLDEQNQLAQALNDQPPGLMGMNTDMPLPDAPAPKQAEVNPFDDLGDTPPAEAAPVMTPAASFVQESARQDANASANPFDDLGEVKPPREMQFMEKAYMSFATTDKERKAAAENIYGKGSKIIKTGTGADEFEVESPDGQIHKVEGRDTPHWYSMKLSNAGNYMRAIVEAAGGIGAEAAVAGGSLALAPETFGASLIGLAATGAAGGIGQVKAGNAAQEALGIPIDPERNIPLEYGIAAGTGGILGAAGGKLAQKWATKQAEKEAVENASRDASKVLVEEVQNLKSSVDNLQSKNILPETVVPGIQNKNFLLTDEFLPGDATQKGIRKFVNDTPIMQAFNKIRGQQLEGAYQTMAKAVGNITAEGPVADRFAAKVADMTKAEGKLLGKFRADAINITKGEALEAPEYAANLISAGEQLGFKKEGNAFITPKPEALINMGIPESQATELVSFMKSHLTDFYNNGGKMTLGQMEAKRKGFAEMADSILQSSDFSSAQKTALLDLKKSLTNDIDNLVESKLGVGSKEAFKEARVRYGEIKDASDTLRNVLKRDSMSANAFASQIFNKGASGIENVKAVKTLIQQEDPTLWKDLVGHHFNNILDSSKDATGKVDWSAVSKKFQGMGPEMLDLVTEGSNISTKELQDFTKIAARIDTLTPETIAKPVNAGAFKRFITLVSHVSSLAKITAGEQVILNAGSEKAALKFIQSTPEDVILKGIDSKTKPIASKLIKGVKAAAEATWSTGAKLEKQNLIRQATDVARPQ